MKPYTMRRVPWTCDWGRFGVATEDLGAAGMSVDEVFWMCHHPRLAPQLRVARHGDCEQCPFWQEAARFRESEPPLEVH